MQFLTKLTLAGVTTVLCSGLSLVHCSSDSNEGTSDASASSTGDASSATASVGGVNARVVFYGKRTSSGEGVFPTYRAHLFGKQIKQALAGDAGTATVVDHVVELVELENTTDKSVNVAFTFRLDGFSSEGKKTFSLAPKQKLREALDATLDFKKLASVTAAIQATYSYEIEVGGQLAKANQVALQVLPKESVFLTDPSLSAQASLDTMIGSLATTNHPSIQALLNIPGVSFAGYQGVVDEAGEQKVVKQVENIYNAIKAKGVNYVSTTESFFTGLQRIRWPSDALNPAITSANCVDGAILFAAATEAINLDPFVVFVPGHAFMGVRLTPPALRKSGNSRVMFVETTMVGKFPFQDAVATGKKNYDEKYVPNAGKHPMTKVVFLADVRENGIVPGPF